MSELRSQELYMLLDEEGFFIHEHSNPKGCKMYGSRLPVWRVRITELAGYADKTYAERKAAPSRYWAWWEIGQDEPFKRERGFEFVWRSALLVDVCFGGGCRYEENRGRGQLLPVNVEPLELVLP